MKTETFQLGLITPCFCGGAEPEKQAEIRAPSIRGQLRWWFRALGGFKSLASTMPVAQQEAMIFGSTAGDEGQASRLIVRVATQDPTTLRSTTSRDAARMNAKVGTDRGYLLFPLRTQSKAVFDKPSLPPFHLQVQWRGDARLWEDIKALIAVFGHLGALGFRAHRAMGALAFNGRAPDLTAALDRFSKSNLLRIYQLPEADSGDPIDRLARWLKSWRSHGRSGFNAAEQGQPGFRYAKNDHDAGAGSTTATTYRPALGLPIIQFYSSSKRTSNWDESWDAQKHKGGGRFASPVILRPHRDAQGKWRALVIFVDAHKWPSSKKVYLNGQPRDVSLDLYEAMKKDQRLQPFP